jgi:phospholipid-translocating ATPase
VEGIVVYAGHETKAMLNNSGPRYKRSQLEQKMNIDVIWCVIILILLCLAGAVGSVLHIQNYTNIVAPFVFEENGTWIEGVYMFLRFVIILQVRKSLN